MQVSLMTPQQTVFQGESDDILVHGHLGQINLLERHADLITKVIPGSLRIKTGGGTKSFEVSDGVLRVKDGRCSILVMTAEPITGQRP